MIAAAVAAVALATVAAGCGGDEQASAQLQALQDDPIAVYTPPGAELVDTDEQSEGETTLGKPQQARFSRLFEVDEADAEQALAATVAAARAAGWTIEGEPHAGVGGVAAIGDRQVDGGRAQLGISLLTDPRVVREGVTPPALKIQLEHLGA